MENVLKKLQKQISETVTKNFKPSGGGAKFFGGQTKRGESAELQADLNSNDKDRQKNAVKRIIANMTLGRDVSQLFVDVVKLGQTLNVELKKLVYLYVLNTANLQPEKALLAVNTFLQDVRHASPVVRALAVRTMMCLRVDSVLEYTLTPLRLALTNENDAYVRKTATVALGKLYHQSPSVFFDQGFMPILVGLLADPFPIVASNAAIILAEINAAAGSNKAQALQTAWVGKLLNCLADCTEWGQIYVLELLATYQPKADEVESLVERILPRLSHANSGVVLGAVKCLTLLLQRAPPALNAGPFITRINAALLTLARAPDPETQYIVCRNIQLLLHVMPSLLQSNLDSFYIRFSDPPYVKIEKLKLLLRLVNTGNANDVLKELGEYSTEIDPTFVAQVIDAVSMVCVKVSTVLAPAVKLLLSILDRRPELLAHVIVACKNVVRKYPQAFGELASPLVDAGADAVADEDAKVAFVWMLGEFCDYVENGRELLKGFVTNFAIQETNVQIAILTAMVKLFLRNPTQMERTVHQVLDTATRQSPSPDVRDRAFLYYRLLAKGIGVDRMKQIVHGTKPPITVDRLPFESMSKTEIAMSVNTSAGVFMRPARAFVPAYGLSSRGKGDDDDLLDEEEAAASTEQPSSPNEVAAAAKPSASAGPSMLGEPAEQKPKPQPKKTDFDSLFDDPAPPAQQQQPQQQSQQQRRVDPMDDIFAPAAPPAAQQQQPPPSQQQQQQPAPAWGGGSSGSNSVSPTTAQAPATGIPTVSSATADIWAEFSASQTADPVGLLLTIRNKGPAPMNDAALQLNRNIFGLMPAQQLTLASRPIAPGERRTIQVPLTSEESHFTSQQQPHSDSIFAVEAGLKLGPDLHRFFVAPPTNLFFAFAPDMDKRVFAERWQAMGPECERRTDLPARFSGANPTELLKALATFRFTFIASAPGQGQGSSKHYGCARTHNGVTVLIELSLGGGGGGTGHVALKSARVNDVAALVHEVLRVVPTKSAVDDLFF